MYVRHLWPTATTSFNPVSALLGTKGTAQWKLQLPRMLQAGVHQRIPTSMEAMCQSEIAENCSLTTFTCCLFSLTACEQPHVQYCTSGHC